MPGPGAAPRLTQGDLMKKQLKKQMVLGKETLRSLDVSLWKVAGATTPQVGCTGVVCPYSSPYYCPREHQTVGSACNP
jgi:hypothetical protein